MKIKCTYNGIQVLIKKNNVGLMTKYKFHKKMLSVVKNTLL